MFDSLCSLAPTYHTGCKLGRRGDVNRDFGRAGARLRSLPFKRCELSRSAAYPADSPELGRRALRRADRATSPSPPSAQAQK